MSEQTIEGPRTYGGSEGAPRPGPRQPHTKTIPHGHHTNHRRVDDSQLPRRTSRADRSRPGAAGGRCRLRKMGRNWAVERATARLQWAHGKRAGYNTSRAAEAAHQDMPGVLAAIEPHNFNNGNGGHFTGQWNRSNGRITVTFRVDCPGTQLSDEKVVDGWVANWGNFIALQGVERTVEWIAVTVDTGPDSGTTIAKEVSSRISSQAPEVAEQIMRHARQGFVRSLRPRGVPGVGHLRRRTKPGEDQHRRRRRTDHRSATAGAPKQPRSLRPHCHGHAGRQ